MNELIERIDSFIQKSRIYLKQGEKPPKGAQVMRGKRGGMYYEASRTSKPIGVKPVSSKQTKQDADMAQKVKEFRAESYRHDEKPPKTTEITDKYILTPKRYKQEAKPVSSKPTIGDRTKRAIDKLTNDPEMEKRAKNAAQETIAIIADDLAVAVNREPTYHEIAEAVLDYGETYGGDKEAIRWLRSLGPDEVARKIQRWDSPPKYAEELKPTIGDRTKVIPEMRGIPLPLTADKTKPTKNIFEGLNFNRQSDNIKAYNILRRTKFSSVEDAQNAVKEMGGEFYRGEKIYIDDDVIGHEYTYHHPRIGFITVDPMGRVR